MPQHPHGPDKKKGELSPREAAAMEHEMMERDIGAEEEAAPRREEEAPPPGREAEAPEGERQNE